MLAAITTHKKQSLLYLDRIGLFVNLEVSKQPPVVFSREIRTVIYIAITQRKAYITQAGFKYKIKKLNRLFCYFKLIFYNVLSDLAKKKLLDSLADWF